jgi:hypothetical protein
MPRWQLLFAAAIIQLFGGIASAQDRPLLQPLKIGYVRHEGAADHLRHSQTLENSLWRRGSQPYWQGFDNGLAAIRALDSGEVDIVLDASLDDVFVSKQANLAMVFIAELHSSSFCCNLEQALADQIDIRYTLSSEHLASYREDILLILYQELKSRLHHARAKISAGAIAVAQSPQLTSLNSVSLVSRGSMQKAASLRPRFRTETIDITDVNYWLPRY